MRRPLRLLSIAHSYVVANNRRLVHEIARAGKGRWEVTAVAPHYFHGGRDLRPVFLERLPEEAHRLVALPAYLTRFIHLFVYHPDLRCLLAEGWDLVHCWEEPYILVGSQVAAWTRRNTPLLYRTAQSNHRRYPPPFNWLEKYAMRRAAGWICSGQTVAENLQNRPGYADRPMRLIPLGVDVDRFRPDPASGKAARQALGWQPEGPPVVGFLGRFVHEKGLGLLTRVLDEVKTPWRVLLVGAGPLESFLRDWANRHKDRVRICTEVRHAEVHRYLHAMDVLCAPSQTTPRWREQFGRMLIEAFACGVPVIGSDSGEIPHVIGDAGIIVGEADETGWHRALVELLGCPERRRELGERGTDRAQGRFAWHLIARQYLDFFEQILDSRQR